MQTTTFIKINETIISSIQKFSIFISADFSFSQTKENRFVLDFYYFYFKRCNQRNNTKKAREENKFERHEVSIFC